MSLDHVDGRSAREVPADLFKAVMGSVCTPVSVVTAFETQAIKSMYIENAQYGGEAQLKRSSIFGAFMLYGHF